jgi:hypothetical protein
LLAEHVFNEATFSRAGWKIVNTPVTLADLVNRNTPPKNGSERWNVTFAKSA